MNLKKTLNMTGLKIKKYSPEILMVAGIATFIGTVVVACKQTTKAGDILEEHKRQMDEIAEASELAEKNELVGEDGELIEYTPDDIKKDKFNVYCHTVVRFGKLYLPAAGLAVVSLTSFLSANKILKTRYLGAVAAFNAVSEAFEKYRERVRQEGGEDLDRHYMYGAESNKIDVTTVDEDGKKKKSKEIVENVGYDGVSPYSRFFDESCPDWDKNPQFNRIILETRQNIANQMLHERGHLFLNEVYDLLGFERTSVGAVVGWVEDLGDGYVDFGLYNQDSKATRRFVNGLENVILLDFNVDGVIYDKI